MELITIEKTITARPISPESFEPFGAIISSSHQLKSLPSLSANQATAIKLMQVNPITDNYSKCPSKTAATANCNMFRCTPPDHLIDGDVYTSKVLERHPFSTQTFIPMGRDKKDIAYMVIVAPTAVNGLPDLEGVQAFTCKGDQAVTYGVGTWHAPMISLGDVTDFAVLIHENGIAQEDCQEVQLDSLKVQFKSLTQNMAAMDLNARAARRKGQSEEAWQKELEQFQTNGPVIQDSGFFDDVSTVSGSSKIDLNRIKYAAERQYYLGNYRTAEQLIQANIKNFHGRLAEELHVILRALKTKL